PRPRWERRSLLGAAGRLHLRPVQRAVRDADRVNGGSVHHAQLPAPDERPAARLRGYLRLGLSADHAGRAAHADARRPLSGDQGTPTAKKTWVSARTRTSRKPATASRAGPVP